MYVIKNRQYFRVGLLIFIASLSVSCALDSKAAIDEESLSDLLSADQVSVVPDHAALGKKSKEKATPPVPAVQPPDLDQKHNLTDGLGKKSKEEATPPVPAELNSFVPGASNSPEPKLERVEEEISHAEREREIKRSIPIVMTEIANDLLSAKDGEDIEKSISDYMEKSDENINYIYKDTGKNLLHLAVEAGNYMLASNLLMQEYQSGTFRNERFNIQLGVRDKHGETELHKLVNLGSNNPFSLEETRRFISNWGMQARTEDISINIKNVNGDTLLHRVIKKAQRQQSVKEEMYELSKFIVSQNVNIFVKNSQDYSVINLLIQLINKKFTFGFEDTKKLLEEICQREIQPNIIKIIQILTTHNQARLANHLIHQFHITD